MKKPLFISLRTKIILLSAILVAFCTVLVGGYVIVQLPSITINSVGGDYITILRSISKTIDIEKFASIKSGDINSEYYIEINREFSKIKDTLGFEHLYLLKRNANNEFFQFTGYVDDADAVSGATVQADAVSGPTGVIDSTSGATSIAQNSVNISEAMRKSFSGEEKFELQDDDEWGKLLSIYFPLKDASDNTIGVLLANLDGNAIYESFDAVRTRILIIGLTVLAVGIIASILFSNLLVKSIKAFQDSMKKVQVGDLTQNIDTRRNDEMGMLGDSFNNLINSLSKIIGVIRNKSNDLNDFASQLASISENIAFSSEETTHSVSEIAAGAQHQAGELLFIHNKLADFNDTVQQIYNSLEATKNNIELTDSLSNEGNIQLQGLNQSIKSTSESFDTVVDEINGLSKNAQQIDEINTVIQNISKQTNLLALNAAIEASRAGEAGKGFSVVADEIRKLAEQSKESSDSIRVIVDDIISSIESVVTTSCDAKDKLTDQVKYVDNTNKAFLSIINSINESIPMLKETFESADKMIKSKDVIIEKVDSVTAVAQETSSGAQEILQATETISAQTQEVAAFSRTLHDLSDDLLNETKTFTIRE
ncbi:MAG: methyl-accepting chemotaxis protein [Clostridiaceae bacterium]|jgi:methyl-accepting chemotaxis protein|nr:methyl-accepting chemotaxis protein [Clostridiaceae bacterium]